MGKTSTILLYLVDAVLETLGDKIEGEAGKQAMSDLLRVGGNM